MSEQDPLEFVRERMKNMTVAQRTQIALNAGVAYRTVQSLMNGSRDTRYNNVIGLRDALLAAEEAKA